MPGLLHFVSQHGYILLFAIVFAEACGLPAPAALALIATGAAAAAHFLSWPAVLVVALCAMLAGDILMFYLGRSAGWGLLAVLCRLSLNPETCILRSAEFFYRRGKLTLLFAKFIPGVNTMAPPLAGSMKMRIGQFLSYDSVGALLYVAAYAALGFVSRDFVARITRGMQVAEHAFLEVVVVAIVVFVVYRVIRYQRYKKSDVVPRMQAHELAYRISNGGKDDVLIVDVRSHGYYDSGATRIAGSLRLEPNRLSEEIKSLPKDKDIYVYCT